MPVNLYYTQRVQRVKVNGAILYISMTVNLLHTNYSLWVFLLDKLDYG